MIFLPQLRFALFGLTVWATSHSTAIAQQALWGMTYGSQFTVATTIERVTEVKIGDGVTQKQATIEQIEILYTLRYVRPTGVVMTAVVTKCGRTGDTGNTRLKQLATQRLGLFKGFHARLTVNVDGVVTDITEAEQSLQQLTDGSSDSNKLMEACCPEPVLRSWLGRPFWMSLPAEKWETEAAWDQSDDLSLGFLGQIRSVVTCQMTDVRDNTATVDISGTTRHIPPLLIPTGKNSVIEFQKPTVAVEEFSGSAKMIRSEDTPDGGSRLNASGRPLFEQLDLKWIFSGETLLKIGNAQKPMTFRQTRKESSTLLPAFSFGGPRVFSQPTPAIPGR